MPSAFQALLAALIACASPTDAGPPSAAPATALAGSRACAVGREPGSNPAPFAVVEACQSPREEAEEVEDEATGRPRLAAPAATGFDAAYPDRATDAPAPTGVPRPRLLYLLYGRLTC